jgi:hypothetical protein
MWDPARQQAQVGGAVALIVWLCLTVGAGSVSDHYLADFRAATEQRYFSDGVLAARLFWCIGSVVGSTWLGCLASGESLLTPSAAMIMLGMGFLAEHRDLAVWPTWYLSAYYVTLPVSAILGGHLMRSSQGD